MYKEWKLLWKGKKGGGGGGGGGGVRVDVNGEVKLLGGGVRLGENSKKNNNWGGGGGGGGVSGWGGSGWM